ncbi:MAG: beta-phosphoglucomutase [Bacteroidales bacterium]|jgi:beta-phosphoglucomutase|nr:beta-phosphoglucomutase [Bacteroidales bacterium]
MIKACIFDLDGVLVDTAIFHYKAWKRLCNELGFDLSEKENEQLKGISRMESLDILVSLGNIKLNNEEKQLYATKKNEWYREYILELTPEAILPGAKDFLDLLKKNNIKIALGSASKNASTILKQLKIGNYFDAVIDGTKVSKSKPDPEVFEKGGIELNTKPENCLVFEDAIAGVQAALNAGMHCVGVGSKDVLTRASVVIPGFKNIDISILEKF